MVTTNGRFSAGNTGLLGAYAALGVSSNASDAEIKAAWKKNRAKIDKAYEIIKSHRVGSSPARKRNSQPPFEPTEEVLRLFAALAAVDGPPNATERRFMETHFGPDACKHPSWNSARHSSVETLATEAAVSYGCDPTVLETLSRLLRDFAFCDGFVSENETSSLSWIDYIFKTRSSKGPASESGHSAPNATVFRCPECGSLFSCDDDSEEYLVECPKCGTQLDLTELEPES